MEIVYRKIHIYSYLINYDLLCEYILPCQSEEEPVDQKHNISRAPFENAAIAKADIDLAIKALPNDMKEAITHCYVIRQGDYDPSLVTRGVNRMYRFLNGLDK